MFTKISRKMNRLYVILLFVAWLVACGEPEPDPNPVIKLEVDLGKDTIICFQDTFLLNAGSAFATYNWNGLPGDSIFTAIDTGMVKVVVTDDKGNRGMDSIYIAPCDVYEQMHCQGDSVFHLSKGQDQLMMAIKTPCYYSFESFIDDHFSGQIVKRLDGEISLVHTDLINDEVISVTENFVYHYIYNKHKSSWDTVVTESAIFHIRSEEDTLFYEKEKVMKVDVLVGILFTFKGNPESKYYEDVLFYFNDKGKFFGLFEITSSESKKDELLNILTDLRML